MSEFRVVLEGIDLEKDHESAIEADIQGAVMRHLARVDLRGDGFALALPSLGEFNGSTKGLWCVRVESGALRALPNVDKAIDRMSP